jgi:hypothetical protein
VVSGKREIDGATTYIDFRIWMKSTWPGFEHYPTICQEGLRKKRDIRHLDYPGFQTRFKIGNLEGKSEVLPPV